MICPELEARKILDKIWNNRGFPVDPVSIAKMLGLQVMDTELPESVSGALIKERGRDPIIALHRYDHPNRKRFTCAHELGHFVSRASSNEDINEYEFIDLRGTSASDGSNEDEIFANRFAANLLMPRSELEVKKRSGYDDLELALYFGVSVEALKIRLKNLSPRP